jgi:hypothetical protein
MKKIASGLAGIAIALVVPGGLIILLCYLLTRNRKPFPVDIKFFNIRSAKQTAVRSTQ